MNKAQDILEKVKRYQFWILCGLVTLIGVASWWMATSSLADTYTKNKSKIESEAGKIGSVQAIIDHPNERWNEKINELVKQDRDEVAKAWQRLYSEQEAKVYVWPKDIFGPQFVAAAEPLAASLRATGAPVGELNSVQRRLYQAEVLRQFRELATLLDAEYADPSQTTGGLGGDRYGGAAATTELLPGQTPRKVIWNGQAELQQPFIWQEPPTTLGVLYAQEELWVIKALCNAIAAANKDSAGAHDAAVRAILAMSVGYEAAEEFPSGKNEPGRITKVTAPAAPTTGYGGSGSSSVGADGGSSGADGAAAPGGGAGGLPRPARTDRKSSGGGGATGYGGVGGESATAAVASTNPAEYLNDWRYVRDDGTPLGFADLASPPFYEYRLMPWRVTMTVDQRKWDELLVMFRNTDLPLEIRQVRLNPVTDAASGGGRYGTSDGGSGGGGYGATSRGGAGGYGAAGGGRYGADGGAGAFGLTAEPIQETATLELRGIAYLLNPPDLEKIGKSGTTTAVDTGAAGATAVPAAASEAIAPTDENPFGTPAVISPPAPSGPAPGAGGGR